MLTLNQFGQVNSSGLKKGKNFSNLVTVFRLYCLFLISINAKVLVRHSRSQFLARECATAYLQALFFATFVQMKITDENKKVTVLTSGVIKQLKTLVP